MPQDERENVTTVEEIVVIGNIASDTAGFWRDLLGFDKGSFSFSHIGLNSGHPGQVEVAIGGVTGGFPVNPDDSPTIGVSAGLEVDPSDGKVSVGLSNGISYIPKPSSGLSSDGLTVTYRVDVPYPVGGVGAYPVPGGDVGERYWGLPPGSGLGPASEPYGF